MLSAGESSASYRWIPACVSQSYDVCVSGCLRACGRQHVHKFTVTHYGHRIQSSTVQDAVQPMKHLAGYCLLAVATGGMILWNFFFLFSQQSPVVLALWSPEQSVQQLVPYACWCRCPCMFSQESFNNRLCIYCVYCV